MAESLASRLTPRPFDHVRLVPLTQGKNDPFGAVGRKDTGIWRAVNARSRARETAAKVPLPDPEPCDSAPDLPARSSPLSVRRGESEIQYAPGSTSVGTHASLSKSPAGRCRRANSITPGNIPGK